MPRGKTYRCVKGFEYSADERVRQHIANGRKLSQEERGEKAKHVIGDKLRERDLPPEVFETCIRRGAIELEGAQSEEVPDDTQG